MLLELNKILKDNNWRFIDFGNYEHDDIMPFSVEVSSPPIARVDIIRIKLRHIDHHWVSLHYDLYSVDDAYKCIDNIRKIFKVLIEIRNDPTLDERFVTDLFLMFRTIAFIPFY